MSPPSLITYVLMDSPPGGAHRSEPHRPAAEDQAVLRRRWEYKRGLLNLLQRD